MVHAHTSPPRRLHRLAALLFVLPLLLLLRGAPAGVAAAPAATSATNIILFIGDGMGPEHVKAGGMFANGAAGSLAFEAFPRQTTMTHANATGGVTDSAASSTAMATGVRVNNGVISVALPGDGRELTTQLEIYRDLGKSTGLVSTSYITDATPAGFGAHETSRSNRAQIFGDYINQTRPVVFLGGGGQGFDSTAAQAQGYAVVTNRAALLALDTETAVRVAGGFGSGEIPADGSPGRSSTLPTLPEMTATALNILDNDPDGFFLLVEHEGSDNYSHAGDTAGMVRSVAELDAAVQAALAWAAGRTDTLILVTADHETGGLAVTETNPQVGVVPAVSWASGGHTQTAVPVFARGPGAEQISGAQIANSDIFTILGPAAGSPGNTVTFQNGSLPTFTYDGARDTTISGLEPTGNFGGSATCLVDGDDPAGSGYDKAALLYWDVSAIPATETVTAAAFTLNVTNASNATYEVYALKRPFTEMQATWNQAAAGLTWETPGAQGSLDREATPVGALSATTTGQATVTLNAAGRAAVQGWIANPAANFGLIIANSTATDGVDFHCRETTSPGNRPALTISTGSAPQADLLDWIWSGAVTSDTAVVNARLLAPSGSVRLLVSESADLSSPLAFGPLAANSANDNTVSFDLSGLAADTAYHYAIEADGVVDDLAHGRFRTFATGAFSYTFAFAGDAEEGSSMPVFDAVREEDALFFISPGDFMYSDITTNNVALFRSAFGNSLRAPRQAALYGSLPIAYVWDDHDFAGNNSNKNAAARPAARQAYREIVPHYPLPAGTGNAPIYQSFAVGRAYFILTDLRSERDPAGNTNDAGRSMMGAAQKQWFKDELLYAKANYPLIFWVSSVPWIAAPANNGDDWGGYHAERVEIADFIKANSIANLVILAADAHMVAADDGFAVDGNSDYATGGGAPLRVLHAAALHRSGSVKGGPYNKGAFPNPSPADGQYGLVQVRDNGGPSISVRFIGKRLPATTLNSPLSGTFMAETQTLIDWQFDLAVPTAVGLRDLSAAPAPPPPWLAAVLLALPLGGVTFVLHRRRLRRRLPD